MNWTDPQTELLSRLWTEGKSANQIAGVLGFTRNAVIGKVHRLGLRVSDKIGSRSPAIVSDASATEGATVDEGDVAPALAQNAPVGLPGFDVKDLVIANPRKRTRPAPSPVTITELTDAMCRWPVDDPTAGEFRYCGSPASGTAPYCVKHAKLAYQPARAVRRNLDRQTLFPGAVADAQKV